MNRIHESKRPESGGLGYTRLISQPMEGKLVNIEGKLAVITGGASGLGRATAEMIIAMGEKSRFLTLTKIWQKQPPAS